MKRAEKMEAVARENLEALVMGSEWVSTTLGEIIKKGEGLIQTGPFGSQLHASDYVTEGVPVIMPVNISNNRVELTNIAKISDEDAKRLSKHIVEEGDIIYSRRGDVTRKALITSEESGMFCGTGCLLLRPGSKIDSRFLTYHLSAPANQEWIVRHAIGATMPNLNTGIMSDIPLKVPGQMLQKAIAHILGTLDDKIELNRQMNAMLESMAQALFKSWFVDFDPVIDNALAAGNPIPEPLHARAAARKALGDRRKPLPQAIQHQFPNRFVFTEEMGWIPEGWDISNLSDIAELKTESLQPNKQPDKNWIHFSIPAFDESKTPKTELGDSIKSGKYRVPKNSVLASKLNPQFPRVWLPDVYDENSSICSTEFMPFIPLNAEERFYLYAFFCSEIVQIEIANRVTGSTGSRQRIKPKEIAEMPILRAPQSIRADFSNRISPILTKIDQNISEDSELSTLRDTLLPKLLSGQLRLPAALIEKFAAQEEIPDAEQLLAEAV